MIELHICYKVGRKMNRNIVSRRMLALLLISLFVVALSIKPVAAHIYGPWPFIPASDDVVELVHWTDGAFENYVNVTIEIREVVSTYYWGGDLWEVIEYLK